MIRTVQALPTCEPALAGGDASAAEVWASRAVDESRWRGTPVFLARALVRVATARSRRGGRTWGPLLEEAMALADATGAHVVRTEARRLELLA